MEIDAIFRTEAWKIASSPAMDVGIGL